MQKPAEMFDRDFEWAELVRFATYAGREPTLGVVSGRRRQGKTYLLDALCSATGGFYFAATEATEAESLRQFGDALAWHTDQPVPTGSSGGATHCESSCHCPCRSAGRLRQ